MVTQMVSGPDDQTLSFLPNLPKILSLCFYLKFLVKPPDYLCRAVTLSCPFGKICYSPINQNIL